MIHYDIVSNKTVCNNIVSYDIILYNIKWHDIESYDTILYNVIMFRFCIIWYFIFDMILYYLIWYMCILSQLRYRIMWNNNVTCDLIQFCFNVICTISYMLFYMILRHIIRYYIIQISDDTISGHFKQDYTILYYTISYTII